MAVLVRDVICSTGVPTKNATYQIVLPIIYLYCFKFLKYEPHCSISVTDILLPKRAQRCNKYVKN